jgi:hypothetical protein
VVVEGEDALGRPRQIDDEPDARIKLSGVPLDFGHDTPWLPPALCLIAEAGEVAAYLVRRSPDRALEQDAERRLGMLRRFYDGRHSTRNL